MTSSQSKIHIISRPHFHQNWNSYCKQTLLSHKVLWLWSQHKQNVWSGLDISVWLPGRPFCMFIYVCGSGQNASCRCSHYILGSLMRQGYRLRLWLCLECKFIRCHFFNSSLGHETPTLWALLHPLLNFTCRYLKALREKPSSVHPFINSPNHLSCIQ